MSTIKYEKRCATKKFVEGEMENKIASDIHGEIQNNVITEFKDTIIRSEWRTMPYRDLKANTQLKNSVRNQSKRKLKIYSKVDHHANTFKENVFMHLEDYGHVEYTPEEQKDNTKPLVVRKERSSSIKCYHCRSRAYCEYPTTMFCYRCQKEFPKPVQLNGNNGEWTNSDDMAQCELCDQPYTRDFPLFRYHHNLPGTQHTCCRQCAISAHIGHSNNNNYQREPENVRVNGHMSCPFCRNEDTLFPYGAFRRYRFVFTNVAEGDHHVSFVCDFSGCLNGRPEVRRLPDIPTETDMRTLLLPNNPPNAARWIPPRPARVPRLQPVIPVEDAPHPIPEEPIPGDEQNNNPGPVEPLLQPDDVPGGPPVQEEEQPAPQVLAILPRAGDTRGSGAIPPPEYDEHGFHNDEDGSGLRGDRWVYIYMRAERRRILDRLVIYIYQLFSYIWRFLVNTLCLPFMYIFDIPNMLYPNEHYIRDPEFIGPRIHGVRRINPTSTTDFATVYYTHVYEADVSAVLADYCYKLKIASVAQRDLKRFLKGDIVRRFPRINNIILQHTVDYACQQIEFDRMREIAISRPDPVGVGTKIW